MTQKVFHKFKNLEVQLFSNILNHGIRNFEHSANKIDLLDNSFKEQGKAIVLANDLDYLCFLEEITLCSKDKLAHFLDDYISDVKFHDEFSQSLEKVSQMEHADDLRFHSLTLYLIARATSPQIIIETGVAQGKSSSLILLALKHNGTGKLISIDLPNYDGKQLPDGTFTTTGDKEVGWLVPQYLRDNWSLHLGDAKDLLPGIISDTPNVDIFFHDSLHTYEHTLFEFNTVLPSLKENSLMLCDNIEMGSGEAFHELLKKLKKIGHAYRDFAGCRL